MQKTKHVIRRIKEGSIAEEMGMEPGDELLEIGGQEIVDIFDYQYLTQDEYIEVLIRRADGEEWLLEIDKEYGEDLGSVPATINVFSVLSTRCRRGCGRRCILKMMIPGFPFCRAIM